MTDHDIELLDAWRHGKISEEDFLHLQSRLDESSELRAELRKLGDLEEALTQHALDALPIFKDISAEPSTIQNKKSYLPWWITAASLLFSIFTWFLTQNQNHQHTPLELNTEFTAIMVDGSSANFQKPRNNGEVIFDIGEYQLNSGIVHLRFLNGADLLIQGPAKFNIKDTFHTSLSFGSVRAIIPPTAHGFTIHTPQVDFEDLGTEFGLHVNPETAESFMHVFDGYINVRKNKSSEVLRTVKAGDSVTYNNGFVEPETLPHLASFPSPENIGYHRWENQDKEMMQDPDLIGWFPFHKQGGKSILTNVRRKSGLRDGRISGARWVTGRWPGKHALLFDRDNDFVQLEIPDEYRELSVALWVKIDSLDFDMNALLNSNEADDGDFHFQINRQGWPRGGIISKSDVSKNKWLGNPIPLSKWTHIVAVTSIEDHTHKIYVNGELSLSSQLHENDILIRPGHCMLGNWLPSPEYQHKSPRTLRGRIDELQVWKRALSQEDIERLVLQGRPNQLWKTSNPPLKLNVL